MILENPKGNVRIFIGNDNFMWQSTKENGRWGKPVKHFSQYNGLMMFNEAQHQLGWHEIKPAL